MKEAVMASTLNPKSKYFFAAARVYMVMDDADKSFLYADKGVGLADFGDAESFEERNKLAFLYYSKGRDRLAKLKFAAAIRLVVLADKLMFNDPVAAAERAQFASDLGQQASRMIAAIRSECLPTGGVDFFAQFRPLDETITNQLVRAFTTQQTCFYGAFPELPLPVRVSQNGYDAVEKNGMFILYPGSAQIRSASFPMFVFDVAANPGEKKNFYPRGETWMMGRFVLKGLPPQAAISLDGKTVTPDGNELTVTPFERHGILVAAPNRTDFVKDNLTVPLAGKAEVEVRCNKTKSWIPWALTAGGVAFLGAGGYFVYAANAAVPSLEADANGVVGNIGREAALSKQDEANMNYAVGWSGIGLGGALVVGGVIWMLLEDTTPPEWR